MTDVTDITVKILGEIRDEIRGTNTRLEQTRVDLQEELRTQVGALVRRQTESEVHLATEVVALTAAVERTNRLLRERLDERDRIDDVARRVSALERGSSDH